MLVKILFVDDDPNILAAFHRQLRKYFPVHTAMGGEEGLRAVVEQDPFAVIVSDLRMPGMDGIQFLSRVREIAPDSVRIMLTGNADLSTAIDAVNEGNIFRFLTKPCEQKTLIKALSAGVRQYQLITAERELLEKTLRGSIKVLSEILQLLNPEAFGRASRITRYAREVASAMGVSDVWQIETAAALSQIGCVMLPESALLKLYKGQDLSGEESQLFAMHPYIGSDLLSHIPRMQTIAKIIANRERNFDASGSPQEESGRGEDIPPGARILKVVLDFDIRKSSGISDGEAYGSLAKRPGRYDPDVLSALREILAARSRDEERTVMAGELVDGMILAEDVRIMDGRMLVARGYEVNRTLLERIKNFSEKPGIKEPVRVIVPVKLVFDGD
ncbi:MAG: HD domain-containing phosphohydrolase [Syntrophobacteraceae bacterium]